MSILTIKPVATAGAAVRRYLPMVVAMRALAVVRTLLVGRILGEAGKGQFGVYNQALELVNWLLPLALLGMDSVAERYVLAFEGKGELKGFLRGQVARMRWSAGVVVLAALSCYGVLSRMDISGAPPESLASRAAAFMRLFSWQLVIITALQIVVLGTYIWTVAILRGLRAFTAAAMMEAITSSLLIVLSILAAMGQKAEYLMAAYMLATAIPIAVAWQALGAYLGGQDNTGDVTTIPGLGRFGRWNVARGFLVMSFGWLAINGVALRGGNPSAVGDFSMAYRLAQLLAYVAVTLWASTYASSARQWTAGKRRRAMYDQVQIGKWGSLAFFGIAAMLVLCRHYVGLIQPNYAGPIHIYLAALLGVFIWYGIVGWLTMLGDVREKPEFGTLLWTAVVAAQAGTLLISARTGWLADPRTASLVACGVGAATGTSFGLITLTCLGWVRHAIWPIVAVALASLAFVGPVEITLYLVPAAGLIAFVMLGLGELIIRPREIRQLIGLCRSNWQSGKAG